MTKVSVMYPKTQGARFRHEYYRDSHTSMGNVKQGDAKQFYTVGKGLAGRCRPPREGDHGLRAGLHR